MGGGRRFGYVSGALKVSTSSFSPSTGPRAHVVGFLAGLRENGLDPAVFLAGDKVQQAKVPRNGAHASSPFLKLLLADLVRLTMRLGMGALARRSVGKVDVLYERQATFQSVGRAFRRRGVPWIVESNGPFWYEASKERKNLALVRAAKKIELDSYRDADLVVAVSERLKSIIVRDAGVDPEKVYVLPNATDTNRFDPRTVVANRFFSCFTVGFVGFLAPWAGLDRLIRAVAAARREGVEISLVVVGDGPCSNDLRALAHELGVAEHIKFTGHVGWDDVPALMVGFDVAYSGQLSMAVGGMYHSPQKLYEYLAMALPVVATAFPDAEGLLAEGRGWTFDPDDDQEPLRTLIMVSGDDDLGQRGRSAREEILRAHTWSARTATLLGELARRQLW